MSEAPSKELKQKKKVYIDTNVIVSAMLEDEKQHRLSKNFLNEIILNPKIHRLFEFYTSIFTLPELASAIYRRTKNREKAYATLYNVIGTWKEALSVLDAPIPKRYSRSTRKWLDYFIRKLVEVAVEYGTPTMDSFHTLILKEYHIDILITWNKKDFKNVCSKLGIELLTPAEFMEVYLKPILKDNSLNE